MSSMPVRWDIFCRVVDNFGDIGVCLRLARQLVNEYHAAVRLWIDDFGALSRFYSRVTDEQFVDGIELRHWLEPFPVVEPADVVIEAFGCELPSMFISAMAARVPQPLWLNLEYLSAENWVDGCHGLPSPQPNGLDKYFFFPGWSRRTGGLLCEKNLLSTRDAFRGRQLAKSFLSRLKVDAPAGAILVSLFSYENPAIPSLLEAMSRGQKPVVCLVPEGRAIAPVEAWLGQPLVFGNAWSRGALSLQKIPFLSQPDYDRLLWSCDLNFVRGEDSFVRAQWAGQPLVWQLYPQQNDAHLPKMEAFLRRYSTGLAEGDAQLLSSFWRCWNRGMDCGSLWADLLSRLPQLSDHSRRWTQALNPGGDLVKNLVHFYTVHI